MDLKSVDPVLTSEIPLDFWCRKDGSDYNLFISHPMMRGLRYPLAIDFYRKVHPIVVKAEFCIPEGKYPLELNYKGVVSTMCTIHSDTGIVEFRGPNL